MTFSEKQSLARAILIEIVRHPTWKVYPPEKPAKEAWEITEAFAAESEKHAPAVDPYRGEVQ